MNYELELETVIKQIKKNKAKTACIQLPDGLKPYAKEIQKRLKQETDTKILIWGGSCFGACDIPSGLEALGVDLLIQFGHSEWR